MKGTVLITGANRGIGLALVQRYIEKSYQVIGVCRQSSSELDASGATVIDNIDVSKAESVDTLLNSLQQQKIDILINNAGIFTNEDLGTIDYDSVRCQFEINALAPLRITEALIGHLKKGSKVALITSRMGSIADNGSGSYYGYRMSKAALNAAGKSLAIDLQHQGIALAILHPGFVQTDMVGYAGDIDPNTCASRLQQRIDDLNLATTGQFWHSNGDNLPW